MNKKLILFMTTLTLAVTPMAVYANESEVPKVQLQAIEERGMLKAATGAYKTWKQYNPAWSSIHLGNSPYKMDDSGCLVTAIATLMVHSGAADEYGVDPGKLCTYLNSNGGFTSSGDLYWEKVNGAVDGFTLANYRVLLSGSQEQKMAQIKNYINQGYYIIASVGGGAHWVAVDRITSDGTNATIFDPAYSYAYLFSQGIGTGYAASGIDRIAIFRSTGSGAGSVDVPSSADVEYYSATGKVNLSASYLNVRSGPGTNYNLLKRSNGTSVSLYTGTSIEITGKAKDQTGALWYEISVDGLKGYVHGSYIVISEENSNETSFDAKNGKITATLVNMRKDAGLNFSVVTTVPKDAVVTATGEKKDGSGKSWYKVTYKNQTGYILAEYVDLSEGNTNQETTYAEKSAKVNGRDVRVRKDAGTNSDIVKTLSLNTALKVVGEKKDGSGNLWYKVKFDGGEGYIFGEYVTMTNETTTTPSTPSYETKTGKVKDDYVNVRSGAGTNHSAVTSLRINTSVTITGEAKDSSGAVWYKIKYVNGEGYMRSDFITISTNSNNNNQTNTYTKKTGKVNASSVNVRSDVGTTNRVVGNLSTGTAVTIIGEKKDSSGKVWYQIQYANGTGYMISDYITIDGASNNATSTDTYEKKAAKVNADSVRVRSGAGTNNSIVTTLSSGAAVTVIGEGKDSSGAKWYKIQFGSSTGYMHSSYVTITNESANNSNTTNTPSYETKTGSVKDDYVNVRSGAGTNYNAVTSLRVNTSITIVGEAKDSSGALWYKIKYANGEGYMRSDFISIGGTSSNENTNAGSNTVTQNYPMEGIEGKEGIVKEAEVYVRKSASKNGEVLTTLKKDVSVLLRSASKDSSGVIWYEVEFAGISGYMMAQYITVN